MTARRILVWTSLVVISSPLLVYVGSAGAKAAPENRPIVFTANGDLYLVNQTGSGNVRLTHTSRQESTPAWSPAGDEIAFSVADQIWIMRADGYKGRKIVALPKGSLIDGITFSPDGKQVAVQATREVGSGTAARPCSSIRVIRTDGSSLRTILAGQDVGAGLTWSPNGPWIAVGFQHENGTQFCSTRAKDGLFRMRPDGTSFETLHAPEGASPDWGPGMIAFNDWRNTCHACGQLWVMKPDGSHQHKLLGAGYTSSFYQPRWSPDGSMITYAHEVSGNISLWAMDANGGNPRRIFKAGSSSLWPFADW